MNDIRNYLQDLQTVLGDLPLNQIDQVIQALQNARLSQRNVFLMGNGGSASTASHFVCDLAKNTRLEGWPDFRVIGLSDNMAIFSAYANDEGYENVFAKQLASLVRTGDVVIGISTSGNSDNVVRACRLARERGAYTIGFTGFAGGRLSQEVDVEIHVASDCIEQVEDVHLMLEHLITKALRERLQQSVADGMSPVSRLEREAFSGPGRNGRDWRTPLQTLRKELQLPSDLSQLLERALLLTVESVGARSGSIIVLNDKGDVLRGVVAYAGQLHESDHSQLAETVRGGLAGWVYRNGQPALIQNTRSDYRWLQGEWDSPEQTPRSAMSVPLMVGDQVVAVLTLVNPNDSSFTESDLALLSAISVLIPLTGEHVIAREELSARSSVDRRVQIGARDIEATSGSAG